MSANPRIASRNQTELAQPIAHRRKRLVFGAATVLSAFLVSCVGTPKLPHYSTIPDGPALPIDGEWLNSGGVKIRITHGKLYTLNKTTTGIPAGSVLSMDIRHARNGHYTCKTESHRGSLFDYGDGKIILTGTTTLILQAAINPKTGLVDTSPSKWRNVSLDAPERYAAEFAAVSTEIKTNRDVTSLLAIGTNPSFKDSDLALNAMIAAVDLLQEESEVVAKDEYKRNFTLPDGSFLPELLHDIKEKRSMAKSASLLVEFFSRGDSTFTTIKESASTNGVVVLSFSTGGINYSRSEYDGDNIAYEKIQRSSRSGTAVTTEVYHVHGVIYRTSKVTGL